MLGGGSHRSFPVATAGSPLARFVARWSAEALMAELATCYTAEVVRTVRPQKCGQLTNRRVRRRRPSNGSNCSSSIGTGSNHGHLASCRPAAVMHGLDGAVPGRIHRCAGWHLGSLPDEAPHRAPLAAELHVPLPVSAAAGASHSQPLQLGNVAPLLPAARLFTTTGAEHG